MRSIQIISSIVNILLKFENVGKKPTTKKPFTKRHLPTDQFNNILDNILFLQFTMRERERERDRERQRERGREREILNVK